MYRKINQDLVVEPEKSIEGDHIPDKQRSRKNGPAEEKRHSKISKHPSKFSRVSAGWRLNVEAKIDDNFMVDRKGDHENLKYGENNRSRVPAYHSSLSRAPLGCTTGHSETTRRQPLLSSLNARERAKIRSDGRLSLSKRIDVCNPFEALEAKTSQDFILLQTGSKNKRKSSSPSLRAKISVASQDYTNETNSNQSTTSDDESELDQAQGEAQTLQNRLKSKNAELSRRLKSDPTRASYWLDYISHQDDWLGNAKYGVSESSNEQRQSISEVKLSIYENAIKNGAIPIEPLLLGMMLEAQHVLNNTELASRWHDIALRNPRCTELQLGYINFLQSDFVQSDVEKCKTQYTTYFGLLQHIDSVPKKVDQQVSALLRYSNYLRDMGYLEHAVALWQAIMEFNLFRPSNVKCSGSLESLRNAVEAFGLFWDSEEPRIGEAGAQGWKDCRSSDNSTNLNVREKVLAQSSDDTTSQWLYEELASLISSSQPGRSINDEGNDPYDVVLFSDLRFFMFDVPFEHTRNLIDAFLTFVQLPSVSHRVHSISSVQLLADQYNAAGHGNVSTIGRSISKSMLEVGENNLDTKPNTLMAHMIQTTETLFYEAQNNWNPIISNTRTRQSTLYEELNFIDRILQQVVKGRHELKDLAEYYLAWRANVSILNNLNFRGDAKSLLSSQPGELRLYNAYALGESKLGSRKHAERAFAASINMSANLEPSSRVERIHLWRSWLWDILRTGEGDPMTVFCTISVEKGQIVDTSKVATGTSDRDISEIQACLEDMLHYWAAQPDQDIVSVVGELYALTEYVHRGTDIDGALFIFSKVAQIIENYHGVHSRHLELLYQAQAQLIQHHIKENKVFSPTRMCAAVSAILNRFPDNTIFLSLYLALEERAGIESRIRRLTQIYFDKQTYHSAAEATIPLTTHAFNIDQDMRHAATSFGSTAHSVRAAFERAVQSPTARHSVVIWTSWVLYEADLASESRSSANNRRFQPAKYVRDIFYRGWRNLPWVKQYAMLAFWPQLRPHFSNQDLRNIYSFMSEKGMRLFSCLDLKDAP